MKKRNVGKVVAALLAAALMLPVGEVSADDATVAQGQLGLTEGETYWFDLSKAGISGTVNASLPDESLSWVPFTYVGEINAYSLDSEGGNFDNTATAYDHSLFIADYNVTSGASWDELNTSGLIFGKEYSSGGVTYELRAPSAQSNTSSEWNAILSKANQDNQNDTTGYIKNWSQGFSWGQDTQMIDSQPYQVIRGSSSSNATFYISSSSKQIGYRPVLELPADLSATDLTTVTIDLNGGSLNSSTDSLKLVVKSDGSYTAPVADEVTAPEGKTFGWWLGSDNKIYKAGATVPANMTSLTARWIDIPVITTQPESAEYYVGETAEPLTVEASVTDGGMLLYTWYSVTKEDFSDFEKVHDSSSYTPPTTAAGTTYYYCVVVNDHDVGLAATETGLVAVTVKEKDTTAPVISGIENGKTYCSSVTFTVEDDNLASVTASVATAEGTKTETLTPDGDGKYTLAAVNETYTVTATDTAGSKTEYKVTVNDGHTFEWKIDKEAAVGVTGSKHEECIVCGHAKAAVEIPALPEPESPIEDENNGGTEDENNGGNEDEYGDENGGANGDVKGNVADRKQNGGDEGASDDNSAQDGGVRAVQTGDDGSVVLPLMSLLMSSFGITGSIAYGQKKRKMRK